MRQVPLVVFSSIVIGLAGCAKPSSEITASVVSPILYRNLDCEQLALEAQRISTQASVAAGLQDQKATNDGVMMAVGLVVFWPALLFVKGNDEKAYEIARLRGEMNAIEQVSIEKKCGIVFQRPDPPKHKDPRNITPQGGRST